MRPISALVSRYTSALARLVETTMIGALLVELRSGTPTVARILPFAILTAFTKTAFRPTRNAFSVDLLSRATVQTDADGRPLKDERGRPLEWKTHLFAMTSLIGTLAAAATLVGLLLGGQILDLAGHRYAPLFAAQALMHLLFVGILFFGISAMMVRVGILQIVIVAAEV
jgi:hypothetical protein